jgi:hypothetical protein
VGHAARLDVRPRTVNKRLSAKWAVGYAEQPRITRPVGCENIDNENKVNRGRQGDASDLQGSDGIVRNNCSNSRGATENDHENPVGIIGNN